MGLVQSYDLTNVSVRSRNVSQGTDEWSEITNFLGSGASKKLGRYFTEGA